MQIILIPTGSYGDVNPYVGIGKALLQRGHRITMLSNEVYAPLAEASGFEFIAVASAEQYKAAVDDPRLWDPRKGFELLTERLMLEPMRRIYERLKDLNEAHTVVLAPLYNLGARLAQERLGMHLITLGLQPSTFWSMREPAVMPGMALPGWLPGPLKRLTLGTVERLFIDKLLAPRTNALRRELGLVPVANIISRWACSPERALGTFPEWYSGRPADWPASLRLTGFASYDLGEERPLPESLERFLAAGEAPIIFTPGSAMHQGVRFFEAAVGACKKLGRRGLLLTRYADQLPTDLPADIAHFEYLPFGRVAPHAAAIVHHGGIGTLAHGLAAGIPQLLMPMAFDQPDNAARIEKLGVGRAIPPERFSAETVAGALDGLLTSEEVRTRCESFKHRVDFDQGIEAACTEIETLI